MKDRNQIELPINPEIKIEESDPVRKVVEICEKLDYTKLESVYLRTRRKVNPRTLFMLLVYGYMIHVYSSREIERLCRGGTSAHCKPKSGRLTKKCNTKIDTGISGNAFPGNLLF